MRPLQASPPAARPAIASRAALALAASVALALAAAPAASADDAGVQPGAADAQSGATTAAETAPAGDEQEQPEPQPRRGKASIDVDDGLPTRKLRYVAHRDAIAVRGTVRPFVRGQVAVLHVRRKGKLVGRKRAQIRRAGKKNAGRVAFKLKMRRKGLFKLTVRHRRTAEQRAFKSNPVRVRAISTSAGEGARGTQVLLLQRGLKRLGYAVPVTGRYDAGTARAVIAFRKANGLERIGYASSSVYASVLRGEGAFKPRYPNAGHHVEYDWSRQVLAFVRNGRTVRAYHSSSGKASTPTVFGTFSFYRKQPGTNSLGMVDSNYFIRGYAIHGYKSVPTYPASHGCLRVPIPNAAQVDRQIELGMKIMVYR